VADIVPEFHIKNLPVSITNVSVFATAFASAANCIVEVPVAGIIAPVIVASKPAFAPVKNLIVLPTHKPLIAVAVVAVVVEPPLAVIVVLNLDLVPHEPA
jgi:hypothetical protein